jgi:hypothetical protein
MWRFTCKLPLTEFGGSGTWKERRRRAKKSEEERRGAKRSEEERRREGTHSEKAKKNNKKNKTKKNKNNTSEPTHLSEPPHLSTNPHTYRRHYNGNVHGTPVDFVGDRHRAGEFLEHRAFDAVEAVMDDKKYQWKISGKSVENQSVYMYYRGTTVLNKY